MKKNVPPLDPRRMRLRGDDEPSVEDVVEQITRQLGREPTAAEVRHAFDIADAQVEALGQTLQ